MGSFISQTIPFRLTVGISGHRNLENTDLIRKTVRRILDDVLSRYPGTDQTEVRLCCLSPLAEGADRLVAREVLGYKGATLKAVLPLTIADYRTDFQTPQSQQEFSDLLKLSRTPLSLRQKDLAEEYPQELLSEARSLAYEQVGKFVVQNCDILIGIWDGKEARNRAGTANIIKYAEQENCPRYVIYTDRPEAFDYIEGDSSANALFRKIDLFNTEKRSPASRDDYIMNVYKELFGKPGVPEGARLSAAVRERVKQYLIPFYVDASLMAKRYQKIYRRTGLAVFWLAFAAMALVGMGAVFFHAPPAVFIIEFFILSFIASLLYYADKIKRSHKNWMEYRFLTERIRAAFFLAISGMEPAQISVSRRSGKEEEAEAWMGITFEEIWNRMPVAAGCGTENCHLLKDYLDRAWIDDQINFHDAACKKNRLKSKRLEKLGEGIFYIAMTAAAAHVIAPAFISWSHNFFMENTLTLFALALPALGATIESIRSHRAYKHIARSSRQMYSDLTRLKNTYQLYHPAMLERYVQETEQLMLRESQEWLALMSNSELYKAV